uniref:(northern house mosquito) hypothetical protein n=1 Tax=Culex pipiens TaxID=7175 RepID=A0A8D8HCN8_CULPI
MTLIRWWRRLRTTPLGWDIRGWIGDRGVEPNGLICLKRWRSSIGTIRSCRFGVRRLEWVPWRTMMRTFMRRTTCPGTTFRWKIERRNRRRLNRRSKLGFWTDFVPRRRLGNK